MVLAMDQMASIMRNLGQLNPNELNLLLAAQSQGGLSMGTPNQYGGLGVAGAGSVDGLSAARNSAMLSLLQQQQQQQQQMEQQQRLQILQNLQTMNSFGGFGGFGSSAQTSFQPQMDNLAFLLQQKQQLQNLQALGGASPQLNPLALLSSAAGAPSLPVASMPSAGLGGLSQGSSQLDALALAKLLQSQQQSQLGGQSPAAGPTATQDLQQAAFLEESGSLPLPPDRRRKGRTGTFPQKLHQMLSDLERQEGGSDIASFLHHGRAFSIHKPRDFVKHVMPKYFRMSRFSSFQRQLNLYDFQRITEGPDKGAYYHELFVQGRPILSTMMKRNKIKGVKNQQNAKKGQEEDHSHEGDEDDGEE